MKLSPIVDGIAEDLRRAGAVGGEETSRVAELLIASIESSVGLRLLDALHVAAKELEEGAPEGTTVTVSLEGRDPVLRLSVPASDTADADASGWSADRLAGYIDDELARLTVRLPEGLKSQIEQVAVRAGASINSWIVSALAGSIDSPSTTGPRPGRRMPRRITGYVQS